MYKKENFYLKISCDKFLVKEVSLHNMNNSSMIIG